METQKIDFSRTTHFTGRNGVGKQTGIEFWEVSDNVLRLLPINSKGKTANCNMNIPREDLPGFVKLLEFFTTNYEPDFSIAVSWTVADVLSQADNDGIELTSSEAKEILQWLDANHDACVGINWTVISTYIDLYIDKVTPNPPFARLIYNDEVYLIRIIRGYIVAGHDLRSVLIDANTGLPKSEREAFIDNDITYYADEVEINLTEDELLDLI